MTKSLSVKYFKKIKKDYKRKLAKDIKIFIKKKKKKVTICLRRLQK